MVDTFRYTFATVDVENISGSDLKEIEKICISHIDKKNLINTRGGSSEKYHINHVGDPQVAKLFKAIIA